MLLLLLLPLPLQLLPLQLQLLPLLLRMRVGCERRCMVHGSWSHPGWLCACWMLGQAWRLCGALAAARCRPLAPSLTASSAA